MSLKTNQILKWAPVLLVLILTVSACSLADGIRTEPPASVQNISIPGVPAEAISLFAEKCSACHGPSGEGTNIAPPLNSAELRNRLDDEALTETIVNGRPGTAMPVWGTTLSAEQIDGLVALIRNWGSLDEDQLAQLAAQSEDCGMGMGMHPGMGPMMGGDCAGDMPPRWPWSRP